MGTRSKLLAVALVAVATAAIPLAARATPPTSDVEAMVDASRAATGSNALTSVAALQQVAQRQAERMRDAGDIFHNAHLAADIRATGLEWTVAGENVGVGADIADIEDAFMRSPEHRSNILDRRFTIVGIGVTQARTGEVYIAQVFAQTSDRSRSIAPPPCDDYVMAEDHTMVPASFYGMAC